MRSLTKTLRALLLGYLLILSTCVGTILASESSVQDLPLVTVIGEGQTLAEVIQDLSKQTGYRIEIGESQLKIKVQGRYIDTDIDSFLRRVFKGSDVFQVIDTSNKVIKISSTQRSEERTLVVEAAAGGDIHEAWLDGEPDKTTADLLEERREVFASYDPGAANLDGEADKTFQDLLDEREQVVKDYQADQQPLDGEAERTMDSLLRERKQEMAKYQAADQPLDGEPGKTTQQLLDSREAEFNNRNPNLNPLDGEPGKTFEDLLKERDRVFGGDGKQ